MFFHRQQQGQNPRSIKFSGKINLLFKVVNSKKMPFSGAEQIISNMYKDYNPLLQCDLSTKGVIFMQRIRVFFTWFVKCSLTPVPA